MKRVIPSAFVGWFLNYARKLKHPQLFKWISLIFLVDLFIPDLVPFVDEVLLGLATLFLASWRKSRKPEPDEKKVKGQTIRSEDLTATETQEADPQRQEVHNRKSQNEHGKH